MHAVLYGLLAIVLAGGLFLLASQFLPAGEQIAPPLRDDAPWRLPPDRPLRPEDVDDVRLPVTVRGYRFAETDQLLDRLASELRARDAELARLRGHGDGGGPSTLSAAPADPDPKRSLWARPPVDLIKRGAPAGNSDGDA